jgi:hypothetical protein
MRGLESWGIINRFITAHPVAEGVPYKNLFHVLTLGQPVDQFKSIFDLTIQLFNTTGDNFPASINRIAMFIDLFSAFDFSKFANMVKHFKGKPQRIHFLMTTPAGILLSHPHAVT